MSTTETPDTDQRGPLSLQMESVLDVARQRYDCWVTFGDGQQVRLTAKVAAEWSNTLLMVAAHARYQAAVLAQVRTIAARDPGDPDDDDSEEEDRSAVMAVAAMKHLRAQLPPSTRLGPLTVAPEVSAATGAPIVAIHRDGGPVAQWTPAEAELHALAVLTVLRHAACDTEYLRWLTGRVGVSLPVASQVIGDLGPHQERMEAATALRPADASGEEDGAL